MRLFLAIELPKEIKDYLFELEKRVKEAKVTWVSKKNLHLTVKFFGEVNAQQLQSIKEEVQTKHPKIHVHLSKLGFFPNKKNPQVIWVGLEPEAEVVQLQQNIDQEFLTTFPSDQTFRAHITLGRVKSIRRPNDFQKSLESISITQKDFVLEKMVLMKSELTKIGPIYEEITTVDMS